MPLREHFMRELARFLKNGSGATAIEYAIIAGGIALVIIATVGGLGSNLNATYTGVQTALK
jgi:pilus assembly protein Flp/PilA